MLSPIEVTNVLLQGLDNLGDLGYTFYTFIEMFTQPFIKTFYSEEGGESGDGY